jgi:dinuclear metal center YbgI/SA1388 family protein
MQVEGRPEIRSIVCGVTANQALIDAAVAAHADALLVHHGWFWRGEDGRVVGIRRKRLKALLENDISLFAYHLPLDAHADLGNNAQLAKLMAWTVDGRFAEQDLGFLGHAAVAASAEELARQLGARLGRAPMLVGNAARKVERIAWCTGAAQSFFEQAIVAGADAFVSGEISEQTVHLAQESGVPYIAAGHHATERYGVQALGAHLARHCGIECRFVEIDNPV